MTRNRCENSTNCMEGEGANSSGLVPEPPLYLSISLTILYTLIFVVGILGNVLVTLVVLRGRRLRTSVNYFLISLCVADLLVIVVCMPTAWVDIYSQDVWYFGEAMCKLVPYLENVVAGASVLTILFISIERYKAICQPLHKSDKAVCRVVKHVAIIWIVCSIASLPFAILPVYRDSIWMDGTRIKVCRNPMKYPWQKFYLTAVPIVFFVLPFVVLAALYCRVGRVLIPKACDPSDIYDDTYREKMRQRRQGINIVICIVLVFFISHLPYRVVCLWHLFEHKDVIINLGLENYLSILYSSRIAFYLNHALNPILYNFVSRKFRAELRWILHMSRCRRPVCTKAARDGSNHVQRGVYPPVVKFKKADNGTVTVIPAHRFNQRVDSTSSEHRKFRNDFSVLYASLHVDEGKGIDEMNSIQEVKDIKTRFSGQISCDGNKKQITSFRVFIRSTTDGFAINVDLEAKSGKRKATGRETCKTTCL